MRQAKFDIVEETPKAVLLRDRGPWGQYPTITNDAANVVQLVLPILNGRRLFYFDSEGELTELIVCDGKFAGFERADGVPFR